MAVKYASATISVTTSATEVNPSFDIGSVSILPTNGAILFRIHNSEGWGDWIPIPEDVSFDDELEGSRIQIKSSVGTVSVNYFLGGI